MGMTSLSIHERTLLVNFIIYRTPRYSLSTSPPPAWFMEAIDSDVQTVLWDRSPRLQADELGSSQEGRKWITFPAYPRVGTNEDGPLLGVGLLPMAEHARALQAIWIARYLNPSMASPKSSPQPRLPPACLSPHCPQALSMDHHNSSPSGALWAIPIRDEGARAHAEIFMPEGLKIQQGCGASASRPRSEAPYAEPLTK